MSVEAPVTPAASGVDPFTAEIIRHSFLSIANQIDVNITRIAYSPLVYEYKDYAVGIVDPEGRLIAQSQGGIPIFMANALGVAVRDGLATRGLDDMKAGDVFISNDTGTLGQHLNNVVMYTPVFGGPGNAEIVAFMAVLMHWIDVGGQVVGSASVTTTESFQEGLRFRGVRMRSQGEPVKDIYSIIASNTRFPRMLFGDIEAQLAGCVLGGQMVAAMIEKYSLNAVRASIARLWARSEQAARDAIRAIPDGSYEAESFIDSDGVRLGEPIRVKVVVRVHGDEMTVDFAGVSPQVRGAINSGREGGAVTAARLAFKYLVTPDDPPNDGGFRPLHIAIPDGTFLSASANAAMGMYSAPLPVVIDTINRALVSAMPERAVAGHHGNFGVMSFSGTDPKTGESFFNLGTMVGGWGASRGFDGAGPYKTMAHGDTLDVPVEVQEALYPLRIESVAMVPDSAGAGEFRGGLGVAKTVTALAPCSVKLNFDRTVTPPWGILGGEAAAAPSVTITRSGGNVEHTMKGIVALGAGDRIEAVTSGGGGYGAPADRSDERVARDVRLGYVSAENAEKIYGKRKQ